MIKHTLGKDSGGYRYSLNLFYMMVTLNVATILTFAYSIARALGGYVLHADVYIFLSSFLTGIVVHILMDNRKEKVVVKFEEKDFTDIASSLLLYLIFSFALFSVAIIKYL